MEKFSGGGGWGRERWGTGEVFLTSGTICPGFINTAGCLFWPAPTWNSWELDSTLPPSCLSSALGRDTWYLSLPMFTFFPTRPSWDRLWGGSAVGTGCEEVEEVSPLCPPVLVHPCPVLAAQPRGRAETSPWLVGSYCHMSCTLKFECLWRKPVHTSVTLPCPALASLGKLRPGEGKKCARGGSVLTKLPCSLFWASCGHCSLSYFGISPPPLPFSIPFPLTSSNQLRYFPVFFFPWTQSSMKEWPLFHAHDCILNFNSFHTLFWELLCSAEGLYIAFTFREQPEDDGKAQSFCMMDASNLSYTSF